MADIDFATQADPASVPTGVATVYVNTSKKLAWIDDGLVVYVAPGIKANGAIAGVLLDSSDGLVDATDVTKKIAWSLAGMTTAVTLTLASAQAASQTLTLPAIREAETLAVRPQTGSGGSAAPVGNVSTTEKAMGLGLVAGFTITPQVTGTVVVWIAGVALNATAAGDGTTITGRSGTGTAPSNGATTGLGTAFGQPQHFVASTTAGQQGFCVMGKVTGLALNTAVWFDLSLVAVTGGGSSVKDVQIIVFEI